LKRRVMTERPRKLVMVDNDNDRRMTAGEVKRGNAIHGHVETSASNEYCHASDPSIDSVLRTSRILLAAAGRDLLSIEQGLSNVNETFKRTWNDTNRSFRQADHFMTLAIHSISRAECLVERALKVCDPSRCRLCLLNCPRNGRQGR
jgi:hypothetical protein